jgi:hypothetical protein
MKKGPFSLASKPLGTVHYCKLQFFVWIIKHAISGLTDAILREHYFGSAAFVVLKICGWDKYAT